LQLPCALLLHLGPTTNQEEYSICISLSAVGSQASGPLSTFCGVYSVSTRDAEAVCESGASQLKKLIEQDTRGQYK